MAGKKRKEEQRQKLIHRQAFDADDASISSKKRSRPAKQHQIEEKATPFNHLSLSLSVYFLHILFSLPLISSDLSSKILKEALNQQKEILQEAEEPNLTPFSPPSVDGGSDEDVDGFDGFSETQSQYDDGLHDINVEDERILAAFMSTDTGPQPTLADLILKKIREKDAEVATEVRPLPQLDRSIIDLYEGYKNEMTKDDKDKISRLFQYQKHHLVMLEVRRELKKSHNRGEKEDDFMLRYIFDGKFVDEI